MTPNEEGKKHKKDKDVYLYARTMMYQATG